MSVAVDINQNALRRLLGSRSGKARRILAERTERIAACARREAPGSMGKTVVWEVTESGRGLKGTVAVLHPAAEYVLKGTRPHVIKPKRANALRFEVGGEVVFAQKVKHPGTKPNNFLERALECGK